MVRIRKTNLVSCWGIEGRSDGGNTFRLNIQGETKTGAVQEVGLTLDHADLGAIIFAAQEHIQARDRVTELFRDALKGGR